MKELNALILAGGISLAVSIAITPAIATNTATASDDGPTLQEIKSSKPRGLVAVPLPPAVRSRELVPVSIVKPAGATVGTTKIHTPAVITKPAAADSTTVTKKTTQTTKTGASATNSHSTKSSPSSANTQTTKSTTAATLPVVPEQKHHPVTTLKPHHHATVSVQPAKAVVKTAIVPSAAPGQKTAALVTTVYDASHILKAWLNKGGAEPHYKPGDKMQINVSADRDCNVMIFDFDGKGKLTQLFPNQYQQDATVKSGETVSVGGDTSPFEYTASLNDGQQRSDEKVFVYAYPVDKEPPLTVAMTSMSSSPFRSGNYSADQYKQLVNRSSVFFSTERNFKIVPKKDVKPISSQTNVAPNKVELPVVIER